MLAKLITLIIVLTGAATAHAEYCGISAPAVSTGSHAISGTVGELRVYEHVNGGAGTYLGFFFAPSSLSVSGRAPAIYTYNVDNHIAWEYGDFDLPCSLADGDPIPLILSVTVVPSAPSGLSVPATNTTGTYGISWNASAGATSYQVQQSVNGGAWSAMYTGSATSTSVSGLAEGVYSYRVAGCLNGYCGDFSAPANTTVTLIPAQPATPSSPTSNTTGSFTVSWSAVPTAISYQLDQRVNGLGWTIVVNGNVTSYPAAGLTNGTYDFQVRACSAAGCSANSGVVTTVVLLPPVAPAVTVPANNGTGSYTVTWNAVSTATSYQLDQQLNGSAFTNVVNANVQNYSATGRGNGIDGYRVRACNASGCSAYSSTASTTVLLPPSVPAASVPATNATGAFNVTWNSIATATSYQLDQQFNGGAWSTVLNANATTYGASGLSNGTYGYRVRACNATGCSGNSTTISTVVSLPPTAPAGLTTPATNTSGAFTISWSAAATATSYQLDQRFNGGTWSNIHNAAATSKAVTGLAAGTYDFQLRACNASGCSANTAAVTTVVGSQPAVATGLTSPAGSATGTFTITWNAVSGATSYQVDQQLNAGTWSQIYSAAAASTSRTTLAVGSYGYRVRACNSFGCSANSATVTTVVAAIPAVTTGLTSPATNNTGAFTVSWATMSGATSYQLDQQFNSGSWSTIHNAAAVSKAVSGLSNGTYNYRVRSCNASGCSANSSIKTTTVALIPAVPTSLTGPGSSTNGSFTLTWGASALATSYQLDEQFGSAGWITTSGLTATSWNTNSNPRLMGSYNYRVRACNAAGCSANTSSVAVNVLWTPTAISSLTPVAVPTVTVAEVNASDAIGSTAGSFRVDESGSATYNIAIMAVPGTAGVTPQVSLNYSSQAGNGLVGKGWSLGGLSAVTRCRQTKQQDGVAKPITWTNQDRFCLDGQRLVFVGTDTANVGKAYGDLNTTYHTEVESYIKVTAINGTAGNPDYFKVERKDGSTTYYGNEPTNAGSDAKINNANGKTLTWAEKKFQDSVGNPIWFVYTNDAAGQRIAEIRYGYGSATAPASYNARLYFNYSDRPDPLSGYTAGLLQVTNKRLTTIVSENAAQIVRQYNLAYKDTETSNGIPFSLSRLITLQECVSAVCLPATQFTWADTTLGFSGTGQSSTLSSNTSDRQSLGYQPADINGDGCADLVWLEFDGGSNQYNTVAYALSDCQNKLNTAAFTNGDNVYTNHNLNMEIHTIDYNGDGRTDVLVKDPAWGTLKVLLAVPQGDGAWKLSSNPIDTGISVTGIGFFQVNVADLDADGMSDVQWTVSDGHSNLALYSRNLSIDTSQPVSSNHYYRFADATTYRGTFLAGAGIGVQPGTDFNGDGLVDAYLPSIYISGDWAPTLGSGGLLVTNPDQSSSQYGPWVGGAYVDVPGIFWMNLVDLNGDGLTDLVSGDYYAGVTGNEIFALNTGVGFTPFSGAFNSGSSIEYRTVSFTDYNQDGYADMVWPGDYSQIYVQLWNPATQSFATSSSQIRAYAAASGQQYLDVNGDGVTDFVNFSGNQVSTFLGLGANQPRHVITKITNGLGAVTNITYGNLTNSGHYDHLRFATGVAQNTCNFDYQGTTGSYDCPYSYANTDAFYTALNGPFDLPAGAETLGKKSPVLETIAPVYVVINVSSSSPQTASATAMGGVIATQTSSLSYYYAEAKIQAGGRGNLGFHKLTTIDDQTGVRTTTTYRQDFPFIGMPVRTEVYTVDVNGPHNLRVADSTWGFQNYGSGHAASPYRPVLKGSVERTYDPANSAVVLSRVDINNSYDAFGNVTNISVNTYAGDAATLVASKQTANTYFGTTAEQERGRLSQTVVTSTRGAEVRSRTSTFAYYGMGSTACSGATYLKGLLCKEIIEPTDSNYTLTTTHEYDAFGNRSKSTVSGTGISTRYTRAEYDTLGRYKERTYNSKEQLVESVTGRNNIGEPLTVSGLNGTRAEMRYGPLGRQYLKYTNDGAYSVTLRYATVAGCPAGTVFADQTVKGGGAQGAVCYDVLARPIRSIAQGFSGGAIYSDTEYDNIGRVKFGSEPYFASGGTRYFTTNTYDMLGRVTNVKLPDGSLATSNYNGLSTTACDARNNCKTETKNALGELTLVTDAKAGTPGTIAYVYYADGLLKSTTTATTNVATGVPTSIATTLTYDTVGRKLTMSDPDKGSWSYSYYVNGELKTQKDAKGQTSTLQYDVLGRMVDRIDCTNNSANCSSGTIKGHSVWTYDTAASGVGQLDNLTDAVTGYVQVVEYDTLGRVAKTGTSLGLSGVDGSYYQRMNFDQYGRAYQSYDASGISNGVKNVYNSQGYLSQILDVASNDELYAVATVNARGQIENERSGGTGAVVTARTYYPEMGRLHTIVSTFNTSTTVQNLSYNYDAVGNMNWRSDQSGGKNVQEVLVNDELNRLTSSTVSGTGVTTTTTTVGFDGYGNIKTKGGVSYGYGNGSNGAGPHAATTVGSTTYVYDANGSNTSSSDGRTITYSTFDKPLTMAMGSYSGQFSYDPNRNLYKRLDTKSSQTTKIITVGGVEYVTQPSGAVDVRRYLPGGIQLTTTYSNGAPGATAKRYQLKDHLGSLDVVLTSTGTVEQALSFDAWGLRRTTTVGTTLWSPLNTASLAAFDHSKTTKGFTGHEMVDEVGIIHMGGRIYDPRIGRFLQADPTLQFPTLTQNYNRYSYVNNNPLIYTDPSGYGLSMDDILKGMDRWVPTVIGGVMSAYCPGCMAFYGAGVSAVQGKWGQAIAIAASPFAFEYIGGEFAATTEANLAATNTGTTYYFAGMHAGEALWLTPAQMVGRIAAEASVGGVMSRLGGGKFGDGFVGAGISATMSPYLARIDSHFAQVIAASALGGTTSALTGGKFANGAISAAFQHLFNDLACSSSAQMCFGYHPTKQELDDHYNDGTGWPVMAETIDVAWLNAPDTFGNVSVGDEASVVTNWPSEIFKDIKNPSRDVGDRNIYGSFATQRIDKTHYTVIDNYGFEPHGWDEPVRNAATAWGFLKATNANPVNMYKSKSFDIFVAPTTIKGLSE